MPNSLVYVSIRKSYVSALLLLTGPCNFWAPLFMVYIICSIFVLLEYVLMRVISTIEIHF